MFDGIVFVNCCCPGKRIKFLTLYFSVFPTTDNRITEFEGRDIPCANDDSSGLVTNGSVAECPLPGEEVLASLGIVGISENFWFNIGMVIVLQFFFRIGAYILLRRSK